MKQKLDSLQALRALAFIGIFASHVQLSAQLGAWGVSVFFVLSGFLMVYTYWDREVSTAPKDCLMFGIRKVSKLYPLHLLTLIMMIPFEVARSVENGTASLEYFVRKVFGSLTLLQSWDPDFWVFGAFNGVAWFLSACLLLYACFPWIWKLLKKVKSALGWGALLAGAYALQVGFVYLTKDTAFSAYPDTNYWISYTFPPLRLLDFFAGCALGCLFLHRKKELRRGVASLLELGAVVLFLVAAVAYVIPTVFLGENWFRYTALWLPSTCMIVYLFACKQGVFTGLLTNKALIRLGNLSPYGFLFHCVAIYYVRWGFQLMYDAFPGLRYEKLLGPGLPPLLYEGLYRGQCGVIAFGLTILASVLWVRYEGRKSKRLSA